MTKRTRVLGLALGAIAAMALLAPVATTAMASVHTTFIGLALAALCLASLVAKTHLTLSLLIGNDVGKSQYGFTTGSSSLLGMTCYAHPLTNGGREGASRSPDQAEKRAPRPFPISRFAQ